MKKPNPTHRPLSSKSSPTVSKLSDPEEAETWLDRANETEEEDEHQSSIRSSLFGDELANELGASVVLSMTSGEDMLMDELDAPITEELDGPLLETANEEDDEFAAQAAPDERADTGVGEAENETDEDEDEDEAGEDEPKEKKKGLSSAMPKRKS